MNATNTVSRLESAIAALEADGYRCKLWRGRSETRLYLVDSYGNEAGYITEDDARRGAGTGSGGRLSRRKGYILGICRNAWGT